MNKPTLCILAATLALAMTGCMSPLQRAAYDGNTNEVRRLLDKGADVNAQYYGITALMDAAAKGHAETVRLLLDKGADVNATRSNGGTVLINAACYGHAECVRLLLGRGADVNAKSSSGWTALINAAAEGRTECVRLLLAHGANIEARTQGNEYAPSRTALEWAQAENFPEIVKLIEAAAQEGAAKRAGEEKRRIEEQLKGATLAQLLEKRELGNEAFVAALTDALIEAKNRELPAFIVKSTVEQRVALVTAVEKRLMEAQTRVAGFNSEAEDAVRQGKSTAEYRRRAANLQAYMGALKAIQELLNQS